MDRETSSRFTSKTKTAATLTIENETWNEKHTIDERDLCIDDECNVKLEKNGSM